MIYHEGAREHSFRAAPHRFACPLMLVMLTRPYSPETRRAFLGKFTQGLGAVALHSLLGGSPASSAPTLGVLGELPLPQKAKRVIWLTMAGGPSHLETFDPKPKLGELHGQPMPESMTQGQQLAQLQGQKLTCFGPQHPFQKFGQNGIEICSLFPQLGSVIEDVCLIRSMTTEAINHDPAITFLQTGNQISGRPSIGAWMHYGLGSDNENLPSFVVLITKGKVDQPLYSRLWGSGFLPARYQGVQFRSGKEPVLYLTNPPGIDAASRRQMLDRLKQLHEVQAERTADPELTARIAQYEMAYRMQTSVPEVTNLSTESQSTLDRYGEQAKTPGTFAANCLLARRLAERGVKFIQLYHQGWDHHGGVPRGMRTQCSETDQPTGALLADLKDRGMLDDTLVVWGGEFGRTVYSQGTLTAENYGRDHHPRNFCMWMAGAGVRGGITYGETDDFSYNIVKDPVHLNDLNATILHLMGIHHSAFTYKFQGLDQRLTGVQEAKIVRGILI